MSSGTLELIWLLVVVLALICRRGSSGTLVLVRECNTPLLSLVERPKLMMRESHRDMITAISSRLEQETTTCER